ncbi:hypothetical protein [Fischerella thermalis]|uniref:hypothetical protein n=1 Tax=Fischerella thermalis TaxID=372787 RepID=UPI001F4461F0|nr:hypothetical protein [Fischerella thermalis]
MYKPLENRWRRDLEIKRIPQVGQKPECYQVKIPNSEQIFEFGLEEYFLCQSMNGVATPSVIIDKFISRFNTLLAEEDFDQFSRQIAECNLLEPFLSESDIENATQEPLLEIKQNEYTRISSGMNFSRKEKHKSQVYIWSAINPDKKFVVLKNIFAPFSLLFQVSELIRKVNIK